MENGGFDAEVHQERDLQDRRRGVGQGHRVTSCISSCDISFFSRAGATYDPAPLSLALQYLSQLLPFYVAAVYAVPGVSGCKTGVQVSYSCKCSFYEIFNEKVFDLVDESNRDNPMGLTVREDTRKGVYVEGLMEEKVGRQGVAAEGSEPSSREPHERTALPRPALTLVLTIR